MRNTIIPSELAKLMAGEVVEIDGVKVKITQESRELTPEIPVVIMRP